MNKEVSRLSDKWVIIMAIGGFGTIGFGIGSTLIPNATQYRYEILGVLIGLIAMLILGKIQVSRLDKKQCNLGQHNPDSLQVCQDCHKHLEGSEDLIDQHNRDLDKALSKKSGIIKFLAPTIAITVFAIGFGYWMVVSSHADIIKGINTMDATDPKSCLMLVEQQAMEKGFNGIMMGSHVIKATSNKWNELDCIHKPIMDEMNKTCPIGVIPTLHGLDGFTCYADEGVRTK